MSYSTIATMAYDSQLRPRVIASAAQEHKTRPYEDWTNTYIWDIVSSPGWAAAWESADAAGKENIGNDPAVITDAMILSAVQPIPPIPDPTQPIPPVEPEPLTLTALEPDTASIGDADFEGHVRGTGFTEDTVIIWNGQEEPTRFVDSTDVWTMVVPSVVTAPTVLDVYVVDNGNASGILQFTWEAAPEEEDEV